MPDGDTFPIPDDVSACPCYSARIPLPIEVPPAVLTVSRGRLSGAGCYVEVSEDGLFARLIVGTAHAVSYQGREPGRWLTRKGATLFLAGPPVAAALAVALGLVDPGVAPLAVVAALLLLAFLLHVLAHLGWKSRGYLADRAREHAWARLVPRLHADNFTLDESAFVAGLALQTMATGFAPAHRKALERAVRLTEQAVAEGRPAIRHLADLQQLAAAGAGADSVSLLAAQLARCFEGRMPSVFAAELLAGRRGTEGGRARLRLLVCDRAFEAGCEVRHLIEAGRIVPALAELLRTDEAAKLAQLRLLWSLRARRPWDKCGPAATAFELAHTSDGEEKLAEYPDLLLVQTVPLARARGGQRKDNVAQGDVIVCGRGVIFQDMLFRQVPAAIEVVSRGLFRRGGHKLVIDGHAFRLPDDPEPLAHLLERWFGYFFREFLPQVAEVAAWQSPAGDAVLRRWGTVACPQCRRIIRTRPGDVGVAVDEPTDTPVK